jgi:hypothetical protein
MGLSVADHYTARGTIAEEEFADNISEVVNSLEGGKDCSCYVGGYECAGIPSKTVGDCIRTDVFSYYLVAVVDSPCDGRRSSGKVDRSEG